MSHQGRVPGCIRTLDLSQTGRLGPCANGPLGLCLHALISSSFDACWQVASGAAKVEFCALNKAESYQKPRERFLIEEFLKKIHW